MKGKIYSFFAILSILLTSGCANYITTDITKDTIVTRSPISTETTITQNLNPETVLSVKVENTVTEKVVTEEVEKKVDLYTPYKGYRKFWEMPLGLLLFPAALVVTVTDVCLFGLIPNKFTDDLLDLSMTGMNPCLNWENENRAERVLKSTVRKPIDSKTETFTHPAEYVNLQLITNKGDSFSFKLNKDGQISILLIKLAVDKIKNPIGLRYFDLIIKSPKKEFTERKIISREMDYKFLRTKILVDGLKKDSSPEKLAICIMELEKLGFTEYALEIENIYISKNKNIPGYTDRFEDQIREHFEALYQ